MSRYAGYTLGEIEFSLDGTEVLIKPSIEDRRQFLILLANFQEEGKADIKAMEEYCYNLLWKSLPQTEQNEEVSKELREFILSKLTSLWVELQIQYKLAKREDIEQLKKEAIEQLKKNALK